PAAFLSCPPARQFPCSMPVLPALRYRTVIKTAVAGRYAKALFELLDSSSVEPVRTGLAGLGRAYEESAALKHVLASPAFRREEKVAILTDLTKRLGIPAVADGFLAQLVRKNRAGFLPDIAAVFGQLVDQAKGARQVTVTSARALDAKEQEVLRTRL